MTMTPFTTTIPFSDKTLKPIFTLKKMLAFRSDIAVEIVSSEDIGSSIVRLSSCFSFSLFTFYLSINVILNDWWALTDSEPPALLQ